MSFELKLYFSDWMVKAENLVIPLTIDQNELIIGVAS